MFPGKGHEEVLRMSNTHFPEFTVQAGHDLWNAIRMAGFSRADLNALMIRAKEVRKFLRETNTPVVKDVTFEQSACDTEDHHENRS